MAYNETYTASDASPVVIDIAVRAGVAIVAFISIIALLVLWKWSKKNIGGRR